MVLITTAESEVTNYTAVNCLHYLQCMFFFFLERTSNNRSNSLMPSNLLLIDCTGFFAWHWVKWRSFQIDIGLLLSLLLPRVRT